MKKLLLVTAHPYQQSFNFALRTQVLSRFEKLNWDSQISDLYQQDFNPLLGTDDFDQFNDEIGFSLASQQSYAYKTGSFQPAIELEQTKLKAADLVILQFPLWWGSFPAILKGWIERVLSYDFAYGASNVLAGKSVMFSVTTGGAANENEEQYYADKISALEKDVFDYIKMNILPTFICHGPARKDQQQREGELQRLNLHLNKTIQLLVKENLAIDEIA